MHGLHLTADLHQCQCQAVWLTDAQKLLAHCIQLVTDAQLHPVAHLGHTFTNTQSGAGGVTATVLLAESHLCIHTWPELQAVTLDVYVCNFGANNSNKAHQLMTSLQSLFQPKQVQQHALTRGHAH
jgi:S-adenosylmethionine decarboxylase